VAAGPRGYGSFSGKKIKGEHQEKKNKVGEKKRDKGWPGSINDPLKTPKGNGRKNSFEAKVNWPQTPSVLGLDTKGKGLRKKKAGKQNSGRQES